MTTIARAKSIRIQKPEVHFADWAFRIEPHHYESLGLGYRQFMKDKKPYFSWAIMDPIEYVFEAGYVFHGVSGENQFLQVVSDWDAFRIEVHSGTVGIEKSRTAYSVTPTELANWLKSGDIPIGVQVLDMPSSKSGILAWELVGER